MDNQQEKKKGGEKMPEPKQTEVTVKTKMATGQQVGIAVAVLAAVAGLVGLGFALFAKPTPPAADSGTPCTLPAAFTLVSPASAATNQDDAVLLKWNASSGAGSYDVYLDKTGGTTKVTTVTTTSYNATQLSIGTKYYWKIIAKNSCGSKSSTIANFTTAGWAYFKNQGYTPTDYSAACGGQRACDTDMTGVTCAEYNTIWLICSGMTNQCPENLEEKCMQQTLCTCGGKNPGLNECADYLNLFVDPCL